MSLRSTLDATADLVPEGAIATHALRIVFFIEPDGEECYTVDHEGDATLGAWLGACELAKEEILSQFRGPRIGDDEEDDDGEGY